MRKTVPGLLLVTVLQEWRVCAGVCPGPVWTEPHWREPYSPAVGLLWTPSHFTESPTYCEEEEEDLLLLFQMSKTVAQRAEGPGQATPDWGLALVPSLTPMSSPLPCAEGMSAHLPKPVYLSILGMTISKLGAQQDNWEF